ncbi:hypothetical protein D3C78_1525290 [compost metagenome]
MPFPVQVFALIVIGAQHFRVFFRYPGRFSAAGGRQENINPVRVQCIQHIIQPAKLIFPFCRFQFRPAEYAYRHHVALGLFHHRDIFLKNIGLIEQLVRIIIRTV